MSLGLMAQDFAPNSISTPSDGVVVTDGLWPPRWRLAAFSALYVCVFLASVIPTILGQNTLAVLMPIPVLLLILLCRNRLLPRYSAYSNARLITIVTLYASSFIYLLPKNKLSGLVSGMLSALAERLHGPPIPDPLGFNAAITFLVLAVVFMCNLLWHRNEISHALANPTLEGFRFRQQDFRASLNRYCTALVAELDRYDRDVNWSDYELTPLEAEVETERRAKLRPRIASDLVEAIRRDRKSTVFIVLGDPGSGKSVSLRRLVRVLCRQAQDMGVVPVYVNLREYPAGESLTTDSVVRFIRETALRQTGRDGRAFIDAWYEIFRKSGRLFFVIDSFDELPAVLDCDDRSEAHKETSACFDRFFTQEVQTCRAVLSSRHFRAPVGVKGTRLVIRPFSETQIRRAMRTWLLGQGIDSTRYIRQLFLKRPHLVPLLRNPFTAELIAEYGRTGAGEKLPDSMFSVFDHYLSMRFASDESVLKRLDTTPKNLREVAGRLARGMYESSDIGLEADLDRVTALLRDSNETKAGEVIEALRYTRIARVGGNDRKRFSFVHRRFAEFFVVDDMCRSNEIPQKDSIPSDSRWRDCLVMYCGIAELPVRQQIAEFCWSVIDAACDKLREGRISEAREAVHCSRFLAEAFRPDPEATKGFRAFLGEVVTDLIKSKDLLTSKIAAEMIPLLDDADQNVAINSAFKTNSPWVCDTTLGSCRHIAKLDKATNNQIRRYLKSIPLKEFIKRFADLNFSMSLSDALRRQRRNLWIDMGEIAFFPVAAAILLIVGAAYFPQWALVCAGVSSGFGAYLWLLLLMSSMKSTADEDSLDKRKGQLILWPLRIINVLNQRREGFVFPVLRLFVSMAAFFLVYGLITGHWHIDELLKSLAPIVSIRSNHSNTFSFLNITSILFLSYIIIVIFFSSHFLFEFVRILADPPNITKEQLLLALKRAVAIDRLKVLVKELAKHIVRSILVFVGIISSVLLGVLGTKYWNLLSAPTRNFLIYTGWVVIVLICIVIGIGLLYIIGIIVKALCQNFIDRTRLNRNGFPSAISCGEAYESCLSYRSREVRRLYLQGLRLRRIPLVGELTDAPAELADSASVKEELARLREQWLGLAG